MSLLSLAQYGSDSDDEENQGEGDEIIEGESKKRSVDENENIETLPDQNAVKKEVKRRKKKPTSTLSASALFGNGPVKSVVSRKTTKRVKEEREERVEESKSASLIPPQVASRGKKNIVTEDYKSWSRESGKS